MNDIYEIIKKIRKEKNITHKELSEKTGIKERTIGNIENSHINSSFINTVLICKELGISLDWLASGGEDIVLTDEEKAFIKEYRELSEREKGQIDYVMNQLLNK